MTLKAVVSSVVAGNIFIWTFVSVMWTSSTVTASFEFSFLGPEISVLGLFAYCPTVMSSYAFETVLIVSPLRSPYCSLTASLCLTILFAFSSVSSESVWRRSERLLSQIPMTNRSRIASVLKVPYSQFSAKL